MATKKRPPLRLVETKERATSMFDNMRDSELRILRKRFENAPETVATIDRILERRASEAGDGSGAA